MNYRHQFHAGNFADVMKHVLLLALFRALQQKPRGFLYLDTHAGRGAYDLAQAGMGDRLERTPEWPEGIGRLWTERTLPPLTADYVAAVRGFDTARGNHDALPRYYPGSPVLARTFARPQDRLVCCEKHPDEFLALHAELRAGPAAPARSVLEMDGYMGLRAHLPPDERRALILIDPPYEAQDEFLQASTALAEALRRFPSGVFALWYPLTQRARVDDFIAELLRLDLPPALALELSIASDDSLRKLKGCGLIVLNPPWRFDATVQPELCHLADRLAQEPGGGYRVNWLVPDR